MCVSASSSSARGISTFLQNARGPGKDDEQSGRFPEFDVGLWDAGRIVIRVFVRSLGIILRFFRGNRARVFERFL